MRVLEQHEKRNLFAALTIFLTDAVVLTVSALKSLIDIKVLE